MAAYLINPQLFTLTLKQPVWTRPPLIPWNPPLIPLYTGGTGGVYTETTEGKAEEFQFSIYDEMYITGSETDASKVKWLSGFTPKINDLLVGTSKNNYYYRDRELKQRLSIPGVDPALLSKPAHTILGAYKGYYSDYPGHVFSVAVAVELPYDPTGALKKSVWGLWVDPFVDADPGAITYADTLGYGNTGSVTPGTGSPTGTTNTETNTGKNMKWVIIIAIIFLWVLKK